ncbi:phosphoglucosamine mutase [Halobacterium litoreum]|uniref:Phosphoglucosamine mutase n=1 Tax=Halobacterium litoreum TaxID=2039234 RepID=A0ABD5NAX0_9EURY|nr:phosphoglucosamine mutase [Halobacterium litoreum]UHH14677.1 phosphoglucosamine mutase [Halobacterium litoreum]
MFGTSGIRGEFGTDVTAGLALRVGRAVASEGCERVVVGRDPRKTGPVLVDAVSAGLRECGADVVRVGEVPTPTVARSVEWYDADAGIAVTASHNPPADNGLKLWSADGSAVVGDEQAAVAERLERDDFRPRRWGEIGGSRTVASAYRRHVAAIADAVTVDPPLAVTVDVGHGSGRLSATALRKLGCEVETMNALPDGSFPARPSEPTAENCERLRRVVAQTDADFGVAHDGDADRALAVTESGRFVSGDVLLALFARREAGPGDRVAVPIDTSVAVRDELAAVGASTTFTKVGDGHVAARTADDDVVFGGEPSGAWIFPALSRCPDGPLAAAKLAALVADHGSLDALVEDVSSVPIRRESVRTDAKRDVVERVRGLVADRYANVTSVDGVRVDEDDGWFLVRASGTQPLVRVTAEARDSDRMRALFDSARDLVSTAARSVGAETELAG